MKILMLAKESDSTKFMYNAISCKYKISAVIIETQINKKKILKRRIKKLGLFKVLGQLLFKFVIYKILIVFSKKRRQELIQHNALDNSNIEEEKVVLVNSINDNKTIEIIKKINPNIIIVNGTSIISKRVLLSTNAKFVNTHVGITPKYRGVHGGYWALVKNDKYNCGVTVHLIDEGIDTGDILYQSNIEISSKDNFVTYPLLQISEGIQLMLKVLKDYQKGSLKPYKSELESKLWYHPTALQYIYFRLKLGVK